ncbi:membrane protein [Erwinia tracheiphila]|uniref:Membrane protein n=1 Tax=Erwinia tracheiphila TaxID=65700 RepID=A0A0M2K4U8_9GAMM|nr:hypothetical protein [Erwinia tracheiphila]AXF75370.1 hypothetical protein AV903_03425 [Erwinia tracheiphila]EOS92749.1 hypothetical protein ETR_22891 [Erwinia tracheiphila PSU-1]KKF34420.1 membrane protein [Erwinia tracheiphila]UIA82086.1 hypothetical protein LU604_15765 [Erwinia tracheiphila]UIA90682.1 hypothetical protein LU632_15325 [Erwinia tracheiphila]
MITNKIIASLGLYFALSGSAMIFLSFLIYAVKIKDYYDLIACYKKRFQFPVPSSFHHMIGFFGAFIVIRFFIKLSHKKNILFMRHDDPAYSFFDDTDIQLKTWMRIYFYLWLTATVFFIFAVALGLLLP